MQRLVLNYHALYTPQHGPAGHDPVFALPTTQVEAQWTLIQQCGIPVLPLHAPTPPGPGTCLSITFDDGHPSDHLLAAPLLQRFQFPATFFLLAAPLIANSEAAAPHRQLLGEGHQIGVHGMHHRPLTQLSPQEQDEELHTARTALEHILQAPLRTFAFPNGQHNAQLLRRAREAGYLHACTTQFALIPEGPMPFAIPRWNIRRTTTLPELEAILNGDPRAIARRTRIQALKRRITRVLGTRLTHQLQTLLRP